MPNIRVLIADDHPLLRNALRSCIEDEPDLMIVAEVENGQDAIRHVIALNPDVAVIDLFMPVVDGIQVVTQILRVNPAAHLMIFTSSTEEDRVAEAIQAGALGYLIKDSGRDEILKAIREVSHGRSYLSPVVAVHLANHLRQKRLTDSQPNMDALTPREIFILNLVGEGASNPDIARQLQIGETTVRTHIHNILQKMGLENRAQLLMAILKQKSKIK